MFETDALVIFDAVARTGSFTAAAEELGYTQSAVSRRIATLEREAGGPLFERLPRGVRLTPAGETLRGHARAALARLRRAEEELAAIHGGTGGRLRIGAFATANAALVPAALREFRRTRPEVEISLTEGYSDALMERLRDGALDLAVVGDYPAGLPAGGFAEVVALLEDELLVALHRDHPLAAGGDVVDLRDLREETWIEGAGWVEGPAGRPSTLTESCARAGFVPKVGVRIAEWTGKLGFVAAGLGVALVPALALPAVRADVAIRSLGEQAPRRTVYAALPYGPALPAARALLGALTVTARRIAALGGEAPAPGGGAPPGGGATSGGGAPSGGIRPVGQ
ncbi:LysR family transcriptional regulator [Microtetraspora sp. NBRC 13810]|uniref:LysR family transcriptional regulator n=1 Tax=Microtetraspora sp. NBRC 13810 TaxID=3030990 RepID=UPI0024A32EDE|nr:LysR family transcriptional regulator [Microtetraspora sp. NBRC 13810]GLW11044.1 LysR family transcriptional regulator [Microtetraspora sp. NBRC 13810]